MNKPKCNECGDDETVYVKVIFYWNEAERVWSKEPFCTEVHCGACCNENVELPDEFLKAEIRT